MIKTLQERAGTLAELVGVGHFYLSDEISFDDKAANKFLTGEIAQPLKALADGLAKVSEFDERQIEQAFTAVLNDKGLALGKLAQPVRVALTGSAASPGIYEVIAVLGKERTLKRLKKALEHIGSGTEKH
ncbi:MAG: hypothetical protein HY587_05425 [Candidatus Omnitrophica bacterium]|nr:hypothetical protein [Candidatus Omnitrophota bacterium]